MMMVLKKTPSHSWWFDSHNSPRRSPWLQSTLSELDGKTKSMLKLIEEDADSFAQRAEMYYKKRPELVSMVEDFYRAHRSLAERYDQLKSEAGTRPMTTPSPSSTKSMSRKLSNLTNKSSEILSDCFSSEESEVDGPEREGTHRSLVGRYDQLQSEVRTRLMTTPSPLSTKSMSRKLSYVTDKSSETSSVCFDSEESEVDDPEQEDRTQVDGEMGEDEEISSNDRESEVMKLRKEIERLLEQDRIQKAELMERNEEKREVIRQLCLAMDMLKEENVSLRKLLKDSKKKSLFEFSKWKGIFTGKLFSGYPKFQTSIVAL